MKDGIYLEQMEYEANFETRQCNQLVLIWKGVIVAHSGDEGYTYFELSVIPKQDKCYKLSYIGEL